MTIGCPTVHSRRFEFKPCEGTELIPSLLVAVLALTASMDEQISLEAGKQNHNADEVLDDEGTSFVPSIICPPDVPRTMSS